MHDAAVSDPAPRIRRVDLNADAGESFGRYALGDDRQVMQAVTSVSIACGWHAGDPGVIRATLAMAREAGVAVGAHPSFPDLQGFGRREMQMTDAELENGVIYQVAAVAGLAAAEGLRLAHVKPHGALYNLACRDVRVASAVASAVAMVDRRLSVYALPASALAHAAEGAGLRVVSEGFADRQYEDDGTLTPRTLANAVLTDPDAVAARAAQWMISGTIATRTGASLPLHIETLCLHGDTPGAAVTAAALRRALESSGVLVAHPE